MNISIVIPNYNGEELLRRNLPKVLESAEAYKGGGVEIIIVDDASSDDSVEVIKNLKFKMQSLNVKFKIIRNEKNLGFSSTVNRGVKETKGEIVLLLNTDVTPEKNFLEPLLPHFRDPKVFAVGCLDKSIDLPAGKVGVGKVVLRGRGEARWERGFLVHSRGEVDRSDTFWVSGGSGAFRKIIWEKLGGFDPLYNPFYWEDIDLSYRAQKAGYKVLFEQKSVVAHKHFEGSIKKHYSPFQVKTIAYRNQFIFVWKNISDISYLASHVLFLPYRLISAAARLDLAFFFGFLRALIRIPWILRRRRFEKRFWARADREILAM